MAWTVLSALVAEGRLQKSGRIYYILNTIFYIMYVIYYILYMTYHMYIYIYISIFYLDYIYIFDI